MDIRLASSADIDAVAELTCQLAREAEGKTLDRQIVRRGLQRLVDGPDTRLYVATTAGGEVAAYVSVSGWEWSEWTATKFLWLGAAYVERTARGKRVVGQILDEVAKYAQEVGASGFKSYVRNDNEPSKKAHELYEFDESDYVVFVKKL